MFIVGVAEDVVVPVRGVILLLVSVFVDEIEGITTPSTAITPAELREIVVSVACPSSKEPTPSAVLVEAVIPATGSPVQFVKVPEEGVPNMGVVSVGDVSVLFVKVRVLEAVDIVTPSIATTPADTLESVVSLACPNSIVPTPSAVEVDEVSPDIGSPVQFVSVPEEGVPRIGVTNVGEVANTNAPEPVSSEMTPFSCREVVLANCASELEVSASPPPGIEAHVPSPFKNLLESPDVGAGTSPLEPPEPLSPTKSMRVAVTCVGVREAHAEPDD